MSPLDLQIIGMAASTAVPIVVSTVILNIEKRSTVMIMFLWMLSTLFLWAFFGLLFYLFDNYTIALYARAISSAFIPFISTAYIFFAIAFFASIQGYTSRVQKYLQYGFLLYAIVIAVTITVDILGFSNFIISGIENDPIYKYAIIPGQFAWTLILHFIGGITVGSTCIYAARKNASIEERSQIKWIIITLFVAFLIGSTRFATWYDLPISPSFAALAPIIATLGILYSLSKHKFFNLRFMYTQFFIILMWLILFYRLFLVQNIGTTAVLLNFIVLFSTLFIGIYLMRNVTINFLQHEKLGILANKLKTINDDLEAKVTERTREVYAEKNRLEMIIENLASGFLEYNNSYEVLLINKAAEDILNINRTDVLKQKWRNSLNAKSQVVLQSLFRLNKNESTNSHPFPKQEIITYEVDITHPKTKHLSVISAPIKKNVSDKQTYILLIRDITDEYELEMLKNDFITIAAHQLRTPLTEMTLALDMTIKTSPELLPPTRKMIDQTQVSTKKMISIVNQLLQVSEIELKNVSYNLVNGDMNTLIIETINDLQGVAHARNIKFLYTRDIEFPTLKLDTQKIKLVLNNLLTNAIAYSKDNEPIEITTHISDKSVNVSIADHGIGINEDNINHVFKKFYRSDGARKLLTDNSGLGLFISQKIIEGHGGKLAIDSKKGVGTIVSLTIPR